MSWLVARLDPRRRSAGAVPTKAPSRDWVGSVPLAVVVAAVWLGVLLVTQVVSEPALDATWTVLAGVALTVPLIIGYPSALRGPRWRRRNASVRPASDDSQGGAAIAAMGRPLPYLRQGLTRATATRTVRALRPLVGDGRCAVAITDLDEVLGWVGPSARTHGAGTALTEPLRAVMTGTRPRGLTPDPRGRNPHGDGGGADDGGSGDGSDGGGSTASEAGPGSTGNDAHAGCGLGGCGPGCRLGHGVAVPLVVRERSVGCLAVLARRGDPPPDAAQVTGVAGLLALHLELAELDREAQLAADARLDALRAQINPHFLFNTLNTIASKARTDPEAARQLLLRLADFFRYSIRQDGQFAEFAQEYFFVRTYLALEQARFGERLEVRYDIDPQVLGVQVPVLVIQPLVENAVRHGLTSAGKGGTVTLRARVDPLARSTAITVHDDGAGMDAATLRQVVQGEIPASGANGVGLANIGQRLDNLFADRYSLDVSSRLGHGTTVALRMPLR